MRVPGRPLRIGLPALFLSVLVSGTVAMPFVVVQTSMTGSIAPGEIVLVDAAAPRFFGVHRGDVVVFRPPVSGYTARPLIKRVVGLPGETIELWEGRVLVDGAVLTEPYVRGQTLTAATAQMVWRVPSGSVFVLGDNRADSWDSRAFGPVKLSQVVGRAWLAYAPLTSVALLSLP